MRTLTLYLKITTFLLLIWMYQCFYNCYSYKTWIDKNILETKNELKYERLLTEGDIEGEKHNYAEGCLKECPLDNEKKGSMDPDKYKNPCDPRHRINTPSLFERFNKKASEMDPNLRDHELNIEWNNISQNKLIHLSSKIYQRDIPDEGKDILILSETKDHSELKKLLDEFKNEIRDNKAESESKKEVRDNRIESESEKEMRTNKTESESEKELRDNRTELESKKEMIDIKKEFEWIKEMIDNKTECESESESECENENEMRENKKKKKKSNILKFLFCGCYNH
ncbi:fam-g protein [Plasmodium gallinaceum]|uniref:Fam-g protein n=1 Tax=Plasmodium gallinaceum TaxID=5849 RepID=A0A1J1GXN9_PLAGA|nr:fam-g protein [Plasmodium gallinaceum]CRG96053.1 fam-g protein [Plasmodium gallinaceum]